MAIPDPAIYTFDSESRHFFDGLGRKVDRKKVRESLDRYIDSINVDITNDTQSMVDGDLTIGAWHLKMEGHIKRVHTGAAAIAKGGWKQAKGSDWAQAGREIKEQYQYLYRFARQLEAGRPVNGGTVARAQMYGLSATKTYEGILRRDDLADFFDLEMRVLHSVVPCERCSYYASLGWQTAGFLPNIGEQCQCLTRCRCTFERKRSKEAQKRRKDSRPKVPKPPAIRKPPPQKPPPVVIPRPVPKPPRPVAPPKVPKPKEVPMPVAPPVAPVPPPEVPKPVPTDPIEAARQRQREENRKWAEENQFKHPEYQKLLRKYPDLLPPGAIQDRIAIYRVGDEKVQAIQALGPKYQMKDAELGIQRTELNRKLLDLTKAQDDIRAPYKGSSKPIPEKVSRKVLELQDQIDEVTSKRDAIKEAQRGLGDTRRKEAHQFLRVKDGATFIAKDADPDNWFHQGSLGLSDVPVMKAKVDEAVKWLSDHVASHDGPPVAPVVLLKESERASYIPKISDDSILRLSTTDSMKTVIHEYTHGIDHVITTGEGSTATKVSDRAIEFLNYRVGDEVPISMRDTFGEHYEPKEMGRKDKFDQIHDGDLKSPAYYSGKEYSDGGAEVTTMGMQELWEDPVKVVTKDPEWAKYLFGIMDGSLR